MKKDQSPESRLLLVDDEPIILNMLANGLNTLGYKVTTFDSPSAALESYKHNTPDLVILDPSPLLTRRNAQPRGPIGLQPTETPLLDPARD